MAKVAAGPAALVTGAARRIGARIARSLHGAGYAVALHCRGSVAEAEALQAELEAARPGSAVVLRADLADPAAAAPLVDTARARFGRLDALVNNASIYHATPLEQADAVAWDAFMAVNARAPLLLARAAAPALRERGGAIVNITDYYADHPQGDAIPYAASKAALVAVTRGLARALAPAVRVNAVAPGAISWPEAGLADTRREAILAATPLGRPGAATDIAGAVLWLLRDAPFVTGQVLHVDGGRTLGD